MSDVGRQLKRHLDALKAAGVEFVADRREEPFDLPEPETLPTLDSTVSVPDDVPDSPDTRRHALAVLAEQVSKCDRCKELFATRTQTVFGVGPVSPELCFVGEAPGGDEDRLGEPFVGAAGQYLNRIIAGDGPAAGGGLHLQHDQVPAAAEPHPQLRRSASTAATTSSGRSSW